MSASCLLEDPRSLRCTSTVSLFLLFAATRWTTQIVLALIYITVELFNEMKLLAFPLSSLGRSVLLWRPSWCPDGYRGRELLWFSYEGNTWYLPPNQILHRYIIRDVSVVGLGTSVQIMETYFGRVKQWLGSTSKIDLMDFSSNKAKWEFMTAYYISTYGGIW